MNAVLLGWVATAYLLAAAMFLVPFGRLADIHGRKRVFTYGTVTFTPVELGIAGQEYFEIMSGVAEGDTVVAGPYQRIRQLQNGDAVRRSEGPVVN